jgi:hypothetical protein
MKLKLITIACRYACYAIGHDYDRRQQQLQVWKGLSTSANQAAEG